MFYIRIVVFTQSIRGRAKLTRVYENSAGDFETTA